MKADISEIINEFLLGMRLKGLRYRRVQLAAPFGVQCGQGGIKAHFHFLAQGRAYLRGPDGQVSKLQTGDAVLLPQGGVHALLSHPNRECRQLTQVQSQRLCEAVHDVIVCGCDVRPEERVVVFSAEMEFELGSMESLVRLMPPVMRAGTLLERSPELLPILEAMEREACSSRAGFAHILARLAEVVAASIVRAWVESGCEQGGGWLQAMRDPRLGKVIAAVHRDPGKDWTLESMAALMGSSRSVFAERFQALTGFTPSRYVAELRMQLAKDWISRERQPIEWVAERLGYSSQAAFSRAFKRITGQPPSAFRYQGVDQYQGVSEPVTAAGA
ncbi:MAG TPA: AraC family transcriptional regulator [Burkholderiaceae bacterium]|nr:AraC family transcriptional regulator [Burkholderiaceae bacterium]